MNETPTEPEVRAPAAEPRRGRAGRFTIARIGPHEVEGHVILLPALALIGFVLATTLLPRGEGAAVSAFEYWATGLGGALLLILSIFAHELSHAVTARAHGLPAARVALFFHGERPEERQEGATPMAELLIAGVGPATSIVLGAAAWLIELLIPGVPVASPLLRHVVIANLLLGLASLIPAFPLDGGRIVRALAWQLTGSRLQGTRAACLAGRVLAAVLLALGLVQLLRGSFGPLAFWGLALALLIHVQAGATWRLARIREGLAGLSVAELAQPLPPILPRQVSVEEALFSPLHAPSRDAARGYLVEFQGRLGGVAPLRSLRRVPEAERAGTPVWELTARLRHEHLLDPGGSAAEAHQRLLRARLPLLPILGPEGLSGILTREALEEAIETRASGNPAVPAA